MFDVNAPHGEKLAGYPVQVIMKRHYTETEMIASIRQTREASTTDWTVFTAKQYEYWRSRPGPSSGVVRVYFGSWRIARTAARDQGGAVEQTNTDPRQQAQACLRCDQRFISQNYANRLCDRCRHQNSQQYGEAPKIRTRSTGTKRST